MNYYLDVFRNYANLNGTLSVRGYWMFILFNIIFTAVAWLISLVIPFFAFIYGLAIMIPTIAAMVRRLRDAGKNPLWILISFVPLVGSIILIVMLCQPSR